MDKRAWFNVVRSAYILKNGHTDHFKLNQRDLVEKLGGKMTVVMREVREDPECGVFWAHVLKLFYGKFTN
jgi:hypothetical protein